LSNGTIGNYLQPNRERPEVKIQYGGLQTGNAYISATRLDNKALPTAKPLFFLIQLFKLTRKKPKVRNSKI